jgi:hypothetical protein
MGNRAVIQFGQDPSKSVGIYLHWNGGRESVQAFLDYAKEMQVRDDDQYFPARLTQIIGNFFGGTLSLGIGIADTLDRDNGDNGTFIVEHCEIVGREFYEDGEFDQTYYEGVLANVRLANDGKLTEG